MSDHRRLPIQGSISRFKDNLGIWPLAGEAQDRNVNPKLYSMNLK